MQLYETGKGEEFYFSFPMLWDKIVKKKIVLKACSNIGETYMNEHLITMDDDLLAVFIFRNAKSFKLLKKLGYLWSIGTIGSINAENFGMEKPKSVNKRFHDIFTYFKILYEKTENNKTDRLCIFIVYKAIINEFHKKFTFLNDGFVLINTVFKLYQNINYLSKNEKQYIKDYYEKFLNSKKTSILYE